MSRSARAPKEKPAPGAQAQADVRGDTYAVAMKPRRGLLAVLAVALALWVAYLLTLYFKTVFPLRHTTPPPVTGRAS